MYQNKKRPFKLNGLFLFFNNSIYFISLYYGSLY
jgi:hypothetical protein